jgi:hypothetical protein
MGWHGPVPNTALVSGFQYRLPPVPSGGNSPESAYFGRLLSPRVRIFSDKRVWVLKRRLRWKRQATHLLCFILEPEQVLA